MIWLGKITIHSTIKIFHTLSIKFQWYFPLLFTFLKIMFSKYWLFSTETIVWLFQLPWILFLPNVWPFRHFLYKAKVIFYYKEICNFNHHCMPKIEKKLWAWALKIEILTLRCNHTYILSWLWSVRRKLTRYHSY